MPKRVWILGAGFSKPLGGPLLDELMRPEVRKHLEATYPIHQFPELFGSESDLVLQLYGYGSRFKDGWLQNIWHAQSGGGELIWSNAEEFLDYLDTAALGGVESTAFKRLNGLLSIGSGSFRLDREGEVGASGAERLAAAAKRLIAGSCSAFLVGADLNTERWEPFVAWAKELGASDTLITFNYDCVLERLGDHTQRIETYRPGEATTRQNAARLLKLHGSVNWKRVKLADGSYRFEVQGDYDFALRCRAEELAIASPGPMKRIMSGWLEDQWAEARSAIEVADAITFIGYRFPPSDGFARSQLLGAVRANANPYLAVHTVLGLGSPDDRRLAQLLRFALASSGRRERPTMRPEEVASWQRQPRPTPYFTLANHPLFGQDFLSVCPLEWIHEAWRVPL